MSRAAFAVWTLIVGSLVGFTGMTLLYDTVYIGASFPVFLSLLTAAVLGSGWVARRPLTARNLWLYAPALFFAVMVAVRADDWLTFYNVVAALMLGALALHYTASNRAFDTTATPEQAGAVITTGLRSALELPFVTLLTARHWFSERRENTADDETPNRTGAIVRGLLLTLPVLGVFALLLGSADAVFAAYLPSLAWLDKLSIDDFIGRVLLTGVLAWFTVGTVTYGVARDWNHPLTTKRQDDDATLPEATLPDRDSLPRPPKRRATTPFRVSMIEGGMLLGGVNLLFGAFVLVQFVYLFGGRENIGVDGLTFAEYARRGFFELVAVAVLTMALLLVTDRVVVREGKREMTLFRVLSLVIIALVGVMLISAARRMDLYTDALGLTRLRLWTSVFMGWLGVLFVVLVAGLLRLRTNVFSFGLVLVGIGFFATMNLINPDARIAAHNIDRALAGEIDFDLCYLSTLSMDATPVIVDRYLSSDDNRLEALVAYLQDRTESHSTQTAGDLGAYNLSWNAAVGAMDGVSATADEDLLYNCGWLRSY